MSNYKYTLNGKLQMTDDQTGEFEIVTENGVFNVSNILDNIFESGLRPQVYVRIMEGTKLLLEEEGGLFLHMDEQKVESYFICGINLSKILFDSTDKVLELVIRQRGNNSKYGNYKK